MPNYRNPQMPDIIAKYKQRLSQELGADITKPIEITSREYQQFKKESYPTHLTLYEKLCNFSERLLKMRLKPPVEQALQEDITIAHLQISPRGAYAFSIIFPLLYLFIGGIIAITVFGSMIFSMFFLFSGLAFIKVAQKLPSLFATRWRMKASNQMVLCVFYIVTYMRHTSNLELAIEFASQHLAPPLSLDLKKVVWDVETEKYNNIKEALDAYLETWRKHNGEFIESMHLIESSLYEGSEERRVELLDKSLDVILDETYEKMLHYAQNLKSPITILHMLGVILPILGLVILPLVVSFMETVEWYHIGLLYNIVLPAIVFYIGMNILATRPTGYGDVDISELAPELKKYKNVSIKIGKSEMFVNPLVISLLIGGIFLLIGFLPVIIHWIDPAYDLSLFAGLNLLEYRDSATNPGTTIGPYGFGASALSLFVPLALAFAFGIYFKLRSKKVMEIRNRAKKLEDEFSSALFQLGNRLGDGLPAELAFDKVAEVMEDSISGRFFRLVSTNIRKLGMGVQAAIFDPKRGAIVYFPSNVIQSSMKVLIESVRKGPRIASEALLNISRYIKEIHKVNERLQDLMAEIISDMKSQTSFLTPMISGIVIGITSMITTILGSLRSQMEALGAEELGRVANIASLFGDGIPTYYFQLVVGLYVFQIVYILTVMANGIENGADKLAEQNALGRNLIKATLMYVFIAFVVMLIFNLIAMRILGATLQIG